MKAEERAMELFEWLDAKFGKECGHNHCNDGDRPPEYGARTASVAFLAAALTLAQQEARAAALEDVAHLKAEIRAAIQAQHYESEAHEATEDECAIDAMSMCQACGNEWPCDDPECWVTRLRALLEGK